MLLVNNSKTEVCSLLTIHFNDYDDVFSAHSEAGATDTEAIISGFKSQLPNLLAVWPPVTFQCLFL